VLPVVALAAAAWVVILVLAPSLPASAGAAIYALGSVVCHQIPERSFYLSGFQLPVCARCFAIYTGASIGAAAFVSAGRVRSMAAWPSGSSRTMRAAALLAALPTIVTVAAEMAGVWRPSNLTRAIAGAPLGVLLAVVVMSALATLHYGGCVAPRPTLPRPPP